MGKLKFTIHPLFYIFGLYFAISGKVFSFLAFTITALIHELGHYYASEKLGYKLKKITLMPYGAIISGDETDFSYIDECKVALAGPLTNLAIGIFFIAVWWVYPEVYPYTDLIVIANFSLAFINILPAYPLDGGRVVLALLSVKFTRKKAQKIAKVIAVFICVALIILFVYSLFIDPNISIIIFVVFLMFGIFDRNHENSYIRVYRSINQQSLKRGIKVVVLAVDSEMTIKKLLSIMENKAFVKIEIYKDMKKIKVIQPFEVISFLESKSLYDKII